MAFRADKPVANCRPLLSLLRYEGPLFFVCRVYRAPADSSSNLHLRRPSLPRAAADSVPSQRPHREHVHTTQNGKRNTALLLVGKRLCLNVRQVQHLITVASQTCHLQGLPQEAQPSAIQDIRQLHTPARRLPALEAAVSNSNAPMTPSKRLRKSTLLRKDEARELHNHEGRYSVLCDTNAFVPAGW